MRGVAILMAEKKKGWLRVTRAELGLIENNEGYWNMRR